MRKNQYDVKINLNLLPRLNGYNGNNIDWNNSVGMSIPFISQIASGKLIFLASNKNKMLVRRIIDGLDYNKEVWIGKTVLLHSNLMRSLFNEIAFTRPDLVQYFKNKNEAFHFTKTDTHQTYFICPKCGFTKMNAISTIDSWGFTCDRCSNRSIGYPNKFMISMLEQLHCKYSTEINRSRAGFDWLENYRFDFLLNNEVQPYFIEMDGHFHFNKNAMSGQTAEESKAIDRYKDQIAQKHGYEVVRINCNYIGLDKRFEFIKNNIINSKLMSVLGIQEADIDWEQCDRDALSNILYTICQCWNDGMTNTKTIAKQLQVSWSCVHTNLKKGASIGLCNYDPKVASQEAANDVRKKRSQPVKVLSDNNIVAVFPSTRELSRQSERIFNVFFNPGHISYSRRLGVSCHGYHIQDITHEEYNRLAPQFQTIQN